MKTNAIIRIILFSIVILLLLGILLAGIGIGTFMYLFNISESSTEALSVGGGSVETTNLNNIEIEWASGSILVYPADVQTIEIHEGGSISEGQELVYTINGNTLKISYSKPSIKIGFFNVPQKDLTVVIPSQWRCDELTIDAASADVSLRNYEGITVDIDTASGANSFENCTISDLSIDTASGDVSYSGSVTEFDCDAASADITAVLTAMPNSINIDTASGDLDLSLPQENDGFTVHLDSVSGKLMSEFDTVKHGDAYIHGNGTCDIEIDCISGDVTIKKQP